MEKKKSVKNRVCYCREHEIPMGSSMKPLQRYRKALVIEWHRKPRGRERLTKEKSPEHLAWTCVCTRSHGEFVFRDVYRLVYNEKTHRVAIWLKNRVSFAPIRPPASLSLSLSPGEIFFSVSTFLGFKLANFRANVLPAIFTLRVFAAVNLSFWARRIRERLPAILYLSQLGLFGVGFEHGLPARSFKYARDPTRRPSESNRELYIRGSCCWFFIFAG